MPEAPITTVGTLIDQLDEKTFRASLPNGKEIIVHIPRAKPELKGTLLVGSKVHLEFTPYDMEKARIAGKIE